MFFKNSLVALAATGSLAAPFLSSRQSTSCASGLQMFVVRGSNEAPGEGVESSVTSSVKKSISGSSSQGIDYPADLTDYTSSESEGVTALTSSIQSYTQACPNGKFALLGFSQGAQVVGDVLGGSSFGGSGPIDKSQTTNLVAVILFGDPAHVAGKPYDKGSSTNNGIEPRSNTATLDSYGALIQSYCDTGDEFCDNGGDLQSGSSGSGSGSGSGGTTPTPTSPVAPGGTPTPSKPGIPGGFPGFTGVPSLPKWPKSTGFPHA